MNPQNISFNQSPRTKMLLKIGIILAVILVLIGIIAAVSSMLDKPTSPTSLKDADTVAFAPVSTPSGFSKSDNKRTIAFNSKDNSCSVLYGVLPAETYSGDTVSATVKQITDQIRSQGLDASDGLDIQALALPSTLGDETYSIPTQQITFTDGTVSTTANYSIQKLKDKKYLSVAQTCSTVDGSNAAELLSSLQTVTKSLQLDVSAQKN